MQRRRLGNTDFDITRIGFGAWAIGGGDWAFGWGDQDDRQSVAAIHRAVELGINWIDTAAVYGFGHSERIVARALAEIPAGRRPLVFTKCSLLQNPDKTTRHSLEPASLRKECEDSLQRLGVETIDLYQIHWPSRGDAAAPGIEDAWRTLADLKQAGKVRWIGVSNFDRAQLERIVRIAPVSSLQPPYSALMREVEKETLPFCAANNIGVINYSPMQSGLLTGTMTRERIANLPDNDWRKRSAHFQEPRLTQNLRVVEAMAQVGRALGKTPGQVAIAWTLMNPAVTGAIVGARRPDQLEELVGAADLTLSNTDMATIEAALPPPVAPY